MGSNERGYTLEEVVWQLTPALLREELAKWEAAAAAVITPGNNAVEACFERAESGPSDISWQAHRWWEEARPRRAARPARKVSEYVSHRIAVAQHLLAAEAVKLLAGGDYAVHAARGDSAGEWGEIPAPIVAQLRLARGPRGWLELRGPRGETFTGVRVFERGDGVGPSAPPPARRGPRSREAEILEVLPKLWPDIGDARRDERNEAIRAAVDPGATASKPLGLSDSVIDRAVQRFRRAG